MNHRLNQFFNYLNILLFPSFNQSQLAFDGAIQFEIHFTITLLYRY